MQSFVDVLCSAADVGCGQLVCENCTDQMWADQLHGQTYPNLCVAVTFFLNI